MACLRSCVLWALLSVLFSSEVAAVKSKRVTAPTPRLWKTVGNEGVLGALPGAKRKQLNRLVLRAGGAEILIKTLSAIPDKVKSDSVALLETLASIFKLTDDEFTVLGMAFWHVSGAPTVELETSLYGGLHFVRGTHMRSWWWINDFRKHPELKFKFGENMVYALCLIAMLTCGPSVYRRICRQVTTTPAHAAHERTPQHALAPSASAYTCSSTKRTVPSRPQARKMNWQSGMMPLLEALWGKDKGLLELVCRNEVGGDTTNLHMAWMDTDKYYVYRREHGNEKGKGASVLTGVSYEQARSHIIQHELPLRKAHLDRMTKWSAIHKKRLVFTPQSESCTCQNISAACRSCLCSFVSL